MENIFKGNFEKLQSNINGEKSYNVQALIIGIENFSKKYN